MFRVWELIIFIDITKYDWMIVLKNFTLSIHQNWILHHISIYGIESLTINRIKCNNLRMCLSHVVVVYKLFQTLMF